MNDETRERLEVGPLPRGGDGTTVSATGSGDNQTSGGSLKIIADAEDWDNSVGINTPGQSGNPDDPHYRDLFELWAQAAATSRWPTRAPRSNRWPSGPARSRRRQHRRPADR